MCCDLNHARVGELGDERLTKVRIPEPMDSGADEYDIPAFLRRKAE